MALHSQAFSLVSNPIVHDFANLNIHKNIKVGKNCVGGDVAE